MADIPFPSSSMPGQKPGEGYGRLINAFCDVDAGVKFWRPSAGSDVFASLGVTGPRGMIVSDGALIVASQNAIRSVSSAGVVTTITGTFTGSKPVTFALNNKFPTRDIVAVTENGCFSIAGGAVTPFADGDLPAVNSVSSLDGFFLWTTANGQIWASGLNDTTVNALSYTNAQSSPDGLLRGTATGGQFFAWGQTSCEVYQNSGETPFPLRRVSVIPVGLVGTWAIAGFQEGWNGDQVFAASDGTVRRLRGYDPQIVSTKDVERAIAAVSDKETIIATSYVVDGNQFVAFSCPVWTWEFNLKTGFWNERQSFDQDRWIGSHSAFFNGSWIIGNNAGSNLLRINDSVYEENGLDISMLIESAPVKEFPARAFIARAMFDFTTGTAPINGAGDVTDPVVSVSWSFDGGGVWGNELQRSLGKIGETSASIRVNRIGLTTHHGARFRLMSSAGVYRTFRGGTCDLGARSPA